MTNCRPRPARDPLALLHPISRYTQAFGALRDQSRLQFSTISGGYRSELTVSKSSVGWPYLWRDCGGGGGEGADPMVRLPAFLRALDPGHFHYNSRGSFCDSDYSPPVNSMVIRVGHRLEAAACLQHALPLCPLPQTPEDDTPACESPCRVVEVDGDTRTPVPPCAPDYRDGHPPPLDPDLPQPICHHLATDYGCPQDIEQADPLDRPQSDRLYISRRSPAQPDRRIEYVCLKRSEAK